MNSMNKTNLGIGAVILALLGTCSTPAIYEAVRHRDCKQHNIYSSALPITETLRNRFKTQLRDYYFDVKIEGCQSPDGHYDKKHAVVDFTSLERNAENRPAYSYTAAVFVDTDGNGTFDWTKYTGPGFNEQDLDYLRKYVEAQARRNP